MKIVLLSTDTYHHWYFINKLKANNINFDEIIFETSSVEPAFKTEPFYKKETLNFEKNRWGDLIKTSEKIIYVNNINDKKAHDELYKINPDLALTFGTRKLTKKTISIFKKYLVNIHRGITQNYRGLDSEYWPIYHNDFGNVGSTLHKIDETLDTGDIIFQSKLDFKKVKNIYNLRALTTEIALKQTIDFFSLLNIGKVKFQKQEQVGRYYSFMPLDLKKMCDKKLKIFMKKNNG